MKVNKESVIFGAIGLLLGLLIAGASAGVAVNNNNRSMMQMMGINTSLIKSTSNGDHMSMSMNDMSDELENRSGDDFDQYFVSMMISHHQGAIDMARLAESRAKHDEVKQLSNRIIDAQTSEINNMKEWQRAWGYDTNGINTMMMH